MRKKVKARRIVSAERSGVRAKLTLDEWWDLQLGASDQFADDAERRANYERHREWLLQRINLGFKPHAFWDYEPDVPDECRNAARDALMDEYDPALHGQYTDWWRAGPPRTPEWIAEYEEYHAPALWADQVLKARRRAWLLGPGAQHLRAGEREEFARQQTEASRRAAERRAIA